MKLSQAWPFVAPFFAFLALLSIEGFFPDQHYLIYPIKTMIVGGIIVLCWHRLPDLKPGFPVMSVLIGIVGVVLWIGLDRWLVHYPQPLLGRSPFALYPAGEAWLLFAFRVAGIALVVPITEELFWRGFLMRWLIRDDFTTVPLGTYQTLSFWVTTVFFAAEHEPEWPLGLVVGILYGTWFVRTKRLGDVIVAHGVTNLLLSFYCLATNDWHFLSIIAPSHPR